MGHFIDGVDLVADELGPHDYDFTILSFARFGVQYGLRPICHKICGHFGILDGSFDSIWSYTAAD